MIVGRLTWDDGLTAELNERLEWACEDEAVAESLRAFGAAAAASYSPADGGLVAYVLGYVAERLEPTRVENLAPESNEEDEIY